MSQIRGKNAIRGTSREQSLESDYTQSKHTPRHKMNMLQLNSDIKQYQDAMNLRQTKKEYQKFEDEYKKALIGNHHCKLTEIRVD